MQNLLLKVTHFGEFKGQVKILITFKVHVE